MNKLMVILVITAILSSCSATGPIFEPLAFKPTNKATIYIYRPYVAFNAAGWPDIFINDEKFFALKNNGYGIIYVSPGQHSIKAEGSALFTNWYPDKVEISHSFESDKEYFIRITPYMTSAVQVGTIMSMAGEANLSVVPRSDAMQEISQTRKLFEPEL